VEGLINI